MWYDIVVLGVLAFFTIRGAMKGVIWQIAGIAGIAICFLFADGISQTVGPILAPHVKLQEPLNHWVILFGAYLVLSLISFAIARSLHQWVEKAQLKEFNQHLGGILGFVKGALLVLVATFLIVTVSPDARNSLKDSKTGWACAQIMYFAHPILPPKLHDSVEQYIHALDDPELEKKYLGLGHTHDHEHEATSSAPIFGGGPPIPNQEGGSALPWVPPGTSAPPTNGSTLLSQLGGLAMQKLEQSIGGANPQSQPQIRDQVTQLLNQLTPQQKQQLESQITSTAQDQLPALLGQWMQAFPPSTQPATTNAGQGGGGSTPRDPFGFLSDTSGNGSTTSAPTGNGQPQVPVSNASQLTPQQLATRRQELAMKIAGKVTSLPAIQNSIAQQVDGVLTQSRVPDGVAISILDDWLADVSGATDPAPATNRNTTPQQRIAYHMQAIQAQGPAANTR